MTDDQRVLFIAVEDILQKHGACFDDLCDTYAQAFQDDADVEEHETVKTLLEQCAERLREAGMDWYVSTK